jgi:hypothetical protein
VGVGGFVSPGAFLPFWSKPILAFLTVKNHRVISNTKTYIESNENSYIHERVHVCIVINITVGFQFRIRLVDWILLVLVGFC